MEAILSSLIEYLPQDLAYIVDEYYGHQLLWHREVYRADRPTRDTLSIANPSGSGLIYHKVFFNLKEVPHSLKRCIVRRIETFRDIIPRYSYSNDSQDVLDNLLKHEVVIEASCEDCHRSYKYCRCSRRWFG